MSQHHQRDCIEILIEKARGGQVSRRTFLQAMGLLAAVPLALRSGISWAADKPLVVVNWGGDALNAFRSAWTDSFTKSTGIPVRIDGAGPTEGAIRSQLASGRPSWDVVDVDSYSAMTLGRDKVLQPLDYSVVQRDLVAPELSHEHGVAGYLFSYVIAWDSQKYGNNGPKNWADFWNVEQFPGKRTLYKWMNGMLEAALLADGVAADQLYPLDVPRALRKIDELKPHVLSFWGSGAESQQLMIEGEASMGAIWHTRATLLHEDSEGRIQWGFDHAFLNASSWGVLKENPAGAAPAMQFIQHALQPAGQLKLFEALGNGPSNAATQQLMSAEQREINCASEANIKKQIFLNTQWYADHYSSTLEQYLTHLSK
ncbi:polyamine ABC transporter substrate-binding protein [Pseudomonas protegens]|uniref:ABC transporter substrate-binding protein n=1 Tax=Pseudomonas protegens TaxID=380021 RepID=UPI000C9C8E6C|nr:ABC transporter substrate-binding protein [Pseudomonas protegens]PNG30762.1 polyamine ABC transporter substrate-binding protein [Pseudomonas protegens]